MSPQRGEHRFPAIRCVFEEKELLLFPVAPQDQPVQEDTLFEMNVFDAGPIDLMVTEPKEATRDENQIVVCEMKITDRMAEAFESFSCHASNTAAYAIQFEFCCPDSKDNVQADPQ